MKKKILSFFALLAFSILPMTLFTACDKDTNCYLDVYVVDEATKNPISGAVIKISQDNGGNVRDEGFTDKNGHCKKKFSAPAIINIEATLAVAGGVRRGETSVRLQEGETINAKIALTSQIHGQR